MDAVLAQYWASLPVGKDQALSYEQLESLWLCGKRQVRKIMERLSCFDNGDNYILIRSSKGGGFYLTDNAEEIAAYKSECMSRAAKVLAPTKKINRVLQTVTADFANLSFSNNIKLIRMERGYTQEQVCSYMQELGRAIDASTLSKIENGYVLPTPAHLSALALIFDCAPFELIDMQEYGEGTKSAQMSLQVP